MKSDAHLVNDLISENMILATVESCTGGLIAHRITEISGSSATFWGSWVVYDNAAKIALGVPEKVIAQHGAVSAETARALADAALARVTATLADPKRPVCVIATTGIAGPSGGTPTKPVGLCFIGLARTGHPTETHEIRGPQELDRSAMKSLFADSALELVSKKL